MIERIKNLVRVKEAGIVFHVRAGKDQPALCGSPARKNAAPDMPSSGTVISCAECLNITLRSTNSTGGSLVTMANSIGELFKLSEDIMNEMQVAGRARRKPVPS